MRWLRGNGSERSGAPRVVSREKTPHWILPASAHGRRSAGTRISSLRRGRGNLSSGRREDPEPQFVSRDAGVFCFACQLDAFSEPDRIFYSRYASAIRGWSICVARGLDFSIAPGLLGVEWRLLCKHESALGRSLSGGGAAHDSGRWDGALHRGPVFESAKPGGVCGDLRRNADTGK